ncbi:hypothetical protein [Mycolicibacterium komossense]|uniref:Major facilitator superfamily (MFS) profile domain-containing protein n=1 Tax=Mycolicibacterium komossense TaxID=1779 RepID=A0ABT3CF94_9MYCO|nr:hypothetical protein [Mycolicibacterium komossense]MCV7228163.1 hypothetical protein [Mycolicibacterium komossense]
MAAALRPPIGGLLVEFDWRWIFFANLTGAGVGLAIPSLSGVTGKALPAHQWGSGSALTNTARQLGTVLGTAILTMAYQSGISMSSVRYGWELIAASAAAAALIAVALAFGWKTTTTPA